MGRKPGRGLSIYVVMELPGQYWAAVPAKTTRSDGGVGTPGMWAEGGVHLACSEGLADC